MSAQKKSILMQSSKHLMEFTKKVGRIGRRISGTEAPKEASKIPNTPIEADTMTESTSSTSVPPENLSLFPAGDPNTAYAKYFVGNSWLKLLTKDRLVVANVTFEPGCRNNWHIHHKGGQILLVTAGRGWYQEEGKPAQALKPGDVVDIPPEVKHWHGAAKNSWFAHIAIEVPAEGASNEWCEPVDEKAYLAL